MRSSHASETTLCHGHHAPMADRPSRPDMSPATSYPVPPFHRKLLPVIRPQRGVPALCPDYALALMERLGSRTAFTFDRHFEQYGFGKIP